MLWVENRAYFHGELSVLRAIVLDVLLKELKQGLSGLNTATLGSVQKQSDQEC